MIILEARVSGSGPLVALVLGSSHTLFARVQLQLEHERLLDM